MAEPEATHEEYRDHQAHIARQPHDVLAGWAVVGCLALGAVLGVWLSAAPGLEPASSGAPFFRADEPALADEIGMVPNRSE